MKTRFFLSACVAVIAGGCAQVVHVPPGTSVEVALAKKPEVVRTPEILMAQAAQPAGSPGGASPGAYIRPVEPELPTTDSVMAVADAYTRGQEAVVTGNNAAAIAAFQQAVAIEPTFSDAWQQLALAYERAGNAEKARAAFKTYKSLAMQ